MRDLSDELGTAVGVGVVIVETDCSVVADISVVFEDRWTTKAIYDRGK